MVAADRERERKSVECRANHRKVDIDFGAGQGISRGTLRKFHSFFDNNKNLETCMSALKQCERDSERKRPSERDKKQANIFFFRLCRKTKKLRRESTEEEGKLDFSTLTSKYEILQSESV